MKISTLLVGSEEDVAFQRRIINLMVHNDLFKQDYSLPYDTYKDITLQRLQEICSHKLVMKDDIHVDPRKVYLMSDVLHSYDFSLGTKFAVQYGLFAGAIANLGSAKHTKYLRDALLAITPGSFAMTEFGHGSDVQGIETTAVYNHQDATFTINTPHDMAQKYWIGNAGRHAVLAVVFAQLIIDHVKLGVHAFIVPIRTSDGKLLDGVHAIDCGIKGGLNGVDNGRLWFSNVVIPYDNLLDRFAKIIDGKYTSEFSYNRQFGATLGELTSGRAGAGAACVGAAATSLTIALELAFNRYQFNTRLIDFTSHQLRLVPLISVTYAYKLATNLAKQLYIRDYTQGGVLTKKTHAIIATIKAIGTWHGLHTAQVCREACGGHGYSVYNKLIGLRNDTDIYCTLEGDNTVMLQACARYLLQEFRKKYKTLEYIRLKLPLYVGIPVSVTDVNYQKVLLEYRVQRLTFDLGNNMWFLLTKHKPAVAWNMAMPTALKLGIAYGQLIAYREFIKHHEILEKLCSLYGLYIIQRDTEFFAKLVNPQTVGKHLVRLCRALAPKALELIRHFLIPEEFIEAPIANQEKLQKSKYYLKSKL